MCNFIIRPIKCYATLDYYEFADGEKKKVVSANEPVSVKYMAGGRVYVSVERDSDDETVVTVPLNIFTHIFSDKDPNKKKDTKS